MHHPNRKIYNKSKVGFIYSLLQKVEVTSKYNNKNSNKSQLGFLGSPCCNFFREIARVALFSTVVRDMKTH